MERGDRNQIGLRLRALGTLLAAALAVTGLAAAGCESGSWQAGSALSNAIGSAAPSGG